MIKNMLFVIIAVQFMLGSCSDESGSDSTPQPSNLNIEIVELDDTGAFIEVQATADNAEFYLIDFGVGDGFTRSTDGTISYKYQEEGTFEIIVRANATDNLFIEDKVSKTIQFNDVFEVKGYTTPMSYDGYTLAWNDEFEGTTLSSNWKHEIGAGNNGWGNNELQYYLEKNTTVNDGYLTIEAKKESVSGREYTSSRIITEGKQEFQYGRIDIRALLPEGQGIWPALWMLGSNFRTAGWPYCGEIDIMEMVGGVTGDKTVHGTLHWDNNGSYACTCEGNSYTLTSGKFSDEFHVFTLLWDESTITWLVDDVEFNVIDITPTDLDEFRNKFFFIFNVAVGGNWPGSPDSSTRFPQKMVVDYVRVFQK